MKAAKKIPTWHAYILRCADGSLYTGITTNLLRRKTMHDTGKASKYTRSRLPVEMVWRERCKNESAARKLEIKIKKMSRASKLALIKPEAG